jgi:uncharacterized protein
MRLCDADSLLVFSLENSLLSSYNDIMNNTTSLENVKSVLKDHLSEIRNLYGVASIGVFGSIVRNDFDKGSDVDLLVDFFPDAKIGFFEFLQLEEYLSKLIGCPVDLVTRNALKPLVGKHILEDLITV